MEARLILDDDGGVIRALSQGANELIASWRLVYYPPFSRIGSHEHHVAHFSSLLCGEARESTNAGELSLRPMMLEFKPAGFRHANAFGPDGALMLSINVSENNPQYSEMFPAPSWMLTENVRARKNWTCLARHVLAGAADADELETITFDLLSMLDGEAGAIAPLKAPPWLKRASYALTETEMSVAEVATDAGVHRAHLSRAFRKHYGVTISDWRHQRRLARAVKLMTCTGASAVEAGHGAGFSDQSHFTRIMQRQTGLTPGALRRGLTDP